MMVNFSNHPWKSILIDSKNHLCCDVDFLGKNKLFYFEAEKVY